MLFFSLLYYLTYYFLFVFVLVLFFLFSFWLRARLNAYKCLLACLSPDSTSLYKILHCPVDLGLYDSIFFSAEFKVLRVGHRGLVESNVGRNRSEKKKIQNTPKSELVQNLLSNLIPSN